MSGIIHKVKDAVTHHGDHSRSTDHHQTGTDTNTYESTQSSNRGPHDSNVANTADPRVDSDRSTQLGGGAYNQSTSSNYGPHDANTANAVDPRIDSDRDGRASYGSTGPAGSTPAYGSTGSTDFAPTTHSSTQPLSAGAGSTGAYGTTGTTGSTGTYGNTGTTGTTGAYGTTGSTTGDALDSSRSTNHGHHDSNIVNKADPRIDSDRDGRASYGSTGAAGTTSTPGTTGAYGSVPSTNSAATGPASSTAGPHSSNVANEADPRVDSDQSKAKKEHIAGEYSGVDRFDRDVHKGSIAGGNQVIGLHGSKGPTTTKNFDQSQHESAAGSSYNTSGSTAGPHKSDTLNKLDPRVDSDLDGSKTVGSNQTGAQQTQRHYY